MKSMRSALSIATAANLAVEKNAMPHLGMTSGGLYAIPVVPTFQAGITDSSSIGIKYTPPLDLM
jgi:hypothetical protein